MYSILLKEDNDFTVTTKERIMQRSKLVDSLRFVVEPTYKGQDMSLYDVSLEYVLPVSKERHSVNLTLEDERFEDYLVYTIPFDTDLTVEAGYVEMTLTFSHLEMDEEGSITQRVRKTSSCFIEIVPIAAWLNFVPDDALCAVDQRILANNAQLQAMLDMQEQIAVDMSNKADGIVYDKDTNKVQLTANGTPVGNAADLTDLANTDGIPAIEFEATNSDNDEGFVVVEF